MTDRNPAQSGESDVADRGKSGADPQVGRENTDTPCWLCRDWVGELRPVCIENRDEIPLLCNLCYKKMREADRIDWQRDAEEFMPNISAGPNSKAETGEK